MILFTHIIHQRDKDTRETDSVKDRASETGERERDRQSLGDSEKQRETSTQRERHERVGDRETPCFSCSLVAGALLFYEDLSY